MRGCVRACVRAGVRACMCCGILCCLCGRYGPLDEGGKLRGGRFGAHAVTEFELACMVRDVEREDLLSVFTDDKGLLYEEEVGWFVLDCLLACACMLATQRV